MKRSRLKSKANNTKKLIDISNLKNSIHSFFISIRVNWVEAQYA